MPVEVVEAIFPYVIIMHINMKIYMYIYIKVNLFSCLLIHFCMFTMTGDKLPGAKRHKDKNLALPKLSTCCVRSHALHTHMWHNLSETNYNAIHIQYDIL